MSERENNKDRAGQVQNSEVYCNRRATRRKDRSRYTTNKASPPFFLFLFVSSYLSIDPFTTETMPPSGSLLFFLESPSPPPLAGTAVSVQPTAQASADSDTSTATNATDAVADGDDNYQTKSHSYPQRGTQQPQPLQQHIHLNLNMPAAESSSHTNATSTNNNKSTLPPRSVLEAHVQPMDETLQLQVPRPGLLPDLRIDPTSTLSTSSPQLSPSSSSPKRKSCMLRSSSISSVDSSSSNTSESSSSSDDSGYSSYLNSYAVSPILLTATTSSKRTSLRRRVFFNTQEPADVCEIIHVSEYTDLERMSAWYNYYDLRSFKRERRETARRIEEHQRRRRQQQVCHHPSNHRHHHVDGDDCDDSIRGVESLTESGSRLRTAFIADGINAVLNEQDLQDQDGTCNPDMLAHVYHSKCEPSRRVAHERALIDQQEARRLYREDKEEEEKKRMQTINIDGVTSQEYKEKEHPAVKNNGETSMVISSSTSSRNNDDETMKTIDLFSPSPQDNNNFQLTLTELETS